MPPLAFGPFEIRMDAVVGGLTHELHRFPDIFLIEISNHGTRLVPREKIHPVGLTTSKVIDKHIVRDRLLHLADLSGFQVVGPENVGKAGEASPKDGELLSIAPRCLWLIHRT
jgi:hypothetical protein